MRAIHHWIDGKATPAQIGGLLMAMRVRGETVDEIAGAAVFLASPAGPIDWGGASRVWLRPPGRRRPTCPSMASRT